MTTKHTPGPWLAKDGEVYRESTGKTVARCDIGGRDTEAEANAHLIAAAPDLLWFAEFMEGYRDFFNTNITPQDADRIRAALNTARGA